MKAFQTLKLSALTLFACLAAGCQPNGPLTPQQLTSPDFSTKAGLSTGTTSLTSTVSGSADTGSHDAGPCTLGASADGATGASASADADADAKASTSNSGSGSSSEDGTSATHTSLASASLTGGADADYDVDQPDVNYDYVADCAVE